MWENKVSFLRIDYHAVLNQPNYLIWFNILVKVTDFDMGGEFQLNPLERGRGTSEDHSWQHSLDLKIISFETALRF